MVKWAFDVFICQNNGKTRLYWRHKDGYRINIGGGRLQVWVFPKIWQFVQIFADKKKLVKEGIVTPQKDQRGMWPKKHLICMIGNLTHVNIGFEIFPDFIMT